MTEPAYDLVFPFVACQTQGGPYDDPAFVAGYQAGRVDRALAAAAAVGADRLTVTALTPLVPQLELIGMHHGFTNITAEPWAEHPDEWTFVTFATPTDTTQED